MCGTICCCHKRLNKFKAFSTYENIKYSTVNGWELDGKCREKLEKMLEYCFFIHNLKVLKSNSRLFQTMQKV